MKFLTYKSKIKFIVTTVFACMTLCNLHAQDEMNVESNDGRVYVEADSIFISANGIFLHLNGVFIPIQHVGVDGNGVYAIPQINAGVIQCSSCYKFFDTDTNSRICPHLKRKY